MGRRKLKDRKCGDCEECCVTLHISDLNKPKHTKCDNLCEQKKECKIYSQRPTECMTFQCLWSQQELPIDQRPDKTDIVSYYVESQFGPTVFITEASPDAFDRCPSAKNSAIAHAGKKKMAVILSTYAGSATAMVP